MKKLFSILILFTLVSCSDDFINNSPISNANVENFFKTDKDFESAIFAAYQTLRLSGVYNDHMQALGELRSDNAEMGTTASNRFNYADISEFRMSTANPVTQSVWNDHYRGISRVNTILQKLENADISPANKTRIEAESKFLRALFYFNLVRVFGEIPLVTSPILTIEESFEFERAAVTTVYQQIISDLIAAEQVLPVRVPASQAGRATKGAAGALLGKVYVTVKDFQSARTVLSNVISSGEYSLLDNYEDLWKSSNKNHRESIFDVQFRRSASFSTGSSFTERYTPYLYPYLPYYSTAGGHNIPTEDLVDAYESGDLRKSMIRESYPDPNGGSVTGLSGRYTTKFYSMPTQGQGADDNWPVIRYADVILLQAEAINELGFTPQSEAFTLLNQIRTRAGLRAKTAGNSNPDLAINNQQEFRLAVEQERRVELAMEGHRWFDLIRTDRMLTVMVPKKNGLVQQHHVVFPLPQSQIDVNPRLNQNAGY
jgi:starch-binding outer membrane protein, SusD/RagB family